jgi:hypothetical protein
MHVYDPEPGVLELMPFLGPDVDEPTLEVKVAPFDVT